MKTMIMDMCILSHKTVFFAARTCRRRRRGQTEVFYRNIIIVIIITITIILNIILSFMDSMKEELINTRIKTYKNTNDENHLFWSVLFSWDAVGLLMSRRCEKCWGLQQWCSSAQSRAWTNTLPPEKETTWVTCRMFGPPNSKGFQGIPKKSK